MRKRGNAGGGGLGKSATAAEAGTGAGMGAGAGEAAGVDIMDAGVDDEAFPILPTTADGPGGRASSPRTSPSGAINGGGSGGGIRGYGSTDDG